MTEYNVILFGLEFKINPVAFTLPIGKNGWDIYWYGIIIAIGLLTALGYGMLNAKRFNINEDKMLDVVLVTVPLAMLGARTYYVLFDDYKIKSIGEFFGFGSSTGFTGLAIFGGVIAAFLVGGLMCWLRKVNVLDMFDLAAIGFLIGQGIGRWGNFTNQEAFGALTGSSWWGMQSENTIRELGQGMVHPCFLYESIWCIAGVIVLHILSKKRRYSGQIALMYAAWYGFGRAFIELLRTDSLYIEGTNIRVSSLLSFALCISAVILMVYIDKKRKEKATVTEYVEMFGEKTEEQEDEKEN